MPAVKYSHNYEEKIQPQRKKNAYHSVPIKKEAQSTKTNKSKNINQVRNIINFTLLSFGSILTLVFIGIYSVVAVSEAKLTTLYTQVNNLNYKNIELENKLENVKSYYSVDNKVSASADFDKAKNIIEVNKVDAKTPAHKTPKNNALNTVTGF